MKFKEIFRTDINNKFLGNLFNNEISFLYCFLILFFGLLPFSNLSITGDIESLLKCRLLSLNEEVALNNNKDLNCIMKNHFFLIDKFIFSIVLLAKKLKFIFFTGQISTYKLLIYYEIFIAIFFYIFFLLNMIFLNILTESKLNLTNIFIVFIFLFTSYLGNFIAFFHQEILIGTIFVLKLINFKKNLNEKNKIIINFVLDFIIATFKIYYLLPIFFLNLYIFQSSYRKFFTYTFLLFFSSLIIFYLNNIQELPMHLKETYKLDLNLKLYLKELFYFFFSPSVGIFITIPLIIFIFFIEKNLLFYLKLIGTLSLIFFLSLFFFWHGSGSSGCRYLYPLLILFYDDFRSFLFKYINIKKFRLILILLFIGFFQSINYQSPVLLFGYKDSKFNENFKILDKERTIGTLPANERFPKFNYKLSPFIFGWSIEFNKLLENNKMLIETLKEDRYLNPLEIIPNSNLSRLHYMSQHNKIKTLNDERLKSIQFKKYINFSNFSYFFILVILFLIFCFFIVKLKKVNQNI